MQGAGDNFMSKLQELINQKPQQLDFNSFMRKNYPNLYQKYQQESKDKPIRRLSPWEEISTDNQRLKSRWRMRR